LTLLANKRGGHAGIRMAVAMAGWGQAIARAAMGLGLALALTCADAARAGVLIEGDETELRVIADKAPLGEVLAVLKAKYRLRYDGAINVSREVNGTVSGTLHRVVVQLLGGHDFVVRRSDEGVEIIQASPHGMANAIPRARPGVTLWETPAAQAMAPAR
jgi:hypothetical protein